MKSSTHRILLIFITVAIIATIGLQFHWNVKNYDENRRRLLNDIQIAFDNGVENYFAETAKKEITMFIGDKEPTVRRLHSDSIPVLDSVFTRKIMYVKRGKSETRSTTIRITGDQLILDSIRMRLPPPDRILNEHAPPEIREFANRIFVSMMRDTMDLTRLDAAVTSELERKGVNIAHDIRHLKKTGPKKGHPQDFFKLKTSAKSTFLPPGQQLQLVYSSPTKLILQRSSSEIILSLLFSLMVIGCLLYLLKVINRQKKIDEIRNDLIANITHEFKTPITTVISAIEGIRNFNAENDKEKTDRYLDISQRQMEKLQGMVDKLLDTATLDTDALVLQKEAVDLTAMLQSITEKYTVGNQTKVIAPPQMADPIVVQADAFHLENAIANIIDNAVKYGGQHIDIKLESGTTHVCISVADDGPGIDNWHRERIFEKFYRIPTGNVHNVKGFGIGLFYSRKIIEKHNGRLELLPDRERTIFKITLPYD
ncbi:hypothetical protein FLLO111716_05560 [Flavobacterium longum]|uniref:sensor histidine kinase n=1 Tax=Flavobacterium longum TaxID=1299340 RepID=UPI0039E98191